MLNTFAYGSLVGTWHLYLLLGLYRIWLLQIRPEPDFAGFIIANSAGAGFKAGLELIIEK